MAKIGRNAPCPCGSGKKYKKCCLKKHEEERLAPRRDQQEAEYIYENLFEAEIIDETEGYEDYDEDETTEPADSGEESPPDVPKPCKQVPDELPEIDDAENALIDEWYDIYKELTDPDELCRHLERFLEEHPELACHLEFHEEALFEIGAGYMRVDRHKDYIDLLIKIRRNFPAAYVKSYGFYDRDIIAYLIMSDRREEVAGFTGFFKEYPDHDPDNLFKTIDLLMAAGCSDALTELVRAIYIDVMNSSNIIGRSQILEPLVLSYYMPYLRSEFTDREVRLLSTELGQIKSAFFEGFDSTDTIKEQLRSIFRPSAPWDLDHCETNQDIYDRYSEVGRNFMGYLHQEHGRDWMTATYYRRMTEDYLVHVIPQGKRPKEPFIFAKALIKKTIAMRCRELIGLNSIRTFGMLNGLYYFAAYLVWTQSIEEDYRNKIQTWCRELYDMIYPSLVQQGFAAKVFNKFPYGQ